MVRELQLLVADGVVELFVVLAFERELTAEQGEHEDTECPDVCWRTRVFDLGHDLGRHI